MNRVFEILDEIVGSVESAKGVPMSSSALLNRPALLDLLDDLRDAFPGAVDDAREILQQRDEIVESARAEAERVQQVSTNEADALVADARKYAESTLSAASAEADRIVAGAQAEATALRERARADAERLVAEGKQEQARQVSDHEVHRAAAASADRIVAAADSEARRLKLEADDYIDKRLLTLEDTLHKLLSTVERGRESVRSRADSHATERASAFDQSG